MFGTLRIKNLALVTDLTLCLRRVTTPSPAKPARANPSSSARSICCWAAGPIARSFAAAATVARWRRCWRRGNAAPRLDKFLEENGLEPCAGGELILKRVFTAAGANRQFINGSPATLQVLAALGRELVDMHGPHDHQSLLDPARQRDILDAFAGLGGLRGQFAALAGRARELEAEKAALIVDERAYAQQLELLRFQAGEISAAHLQPGEEARQEQEFQRASNAARLLELSQAALNLF